MKLQFLDSYPAHIAEIILDARAAGLEVNVGRTVCHVVAKRERRWNKVTKGLMMYVDGSAFDLTVRLDVARCITRKSKMRQMLGLQ